MVPGRGTVGGGIGHGPSSVGRGSDTPGRHRASGAEKRRVGDGRRVGPRYTGAVTELSVPSGTAVPTEQPFDDEGVGIDRTTGTLGRIRKLLARAERAGTPAEAQACTDKAVELMARHGIDMALLAAAQPGVDEIGATRVEVADPYSAGKARLLGWTASALRCRAVLHELRGARQFGRGRIAAVTVFGFASDRERVEVLFTLLLLQASRRARGAAARVRTSRSRRTGARGCTGSPCGCTGGWSRPRPRRAESRAGVRRAIRARPAARSWCSPIGVAGSIRPTPSRSPHSAGQAVGAVRSRAGGGRGRR